MAALGSMPYGDGNIDINISETHNQLPSPLSTGHLPTGDWMADDDVFQAEEDEKAMLAFGWEAPGESWGGLGQPPPASPNVGGALGGSSDNVQPIFDELAHNDSALKSALDTICSREHSAAQRSMDESDDIASILLDSEMDNDDICTKLAEDLVKELASSASRHHRAVLAEYFKLEDFPHSAAQMVMLGVSTQGAKPEPDEDTTSSMHTCLHTVRPGDTSASMAAQRSVAHVDSDMDFSRHDTHDGAEEKPIVASRSAPFRAHRATDNVTPPTRRVSHKHITAVSKSRDAATVKTRRKGPTRRKRSDRTATPARQGAPPAAAIHAPLPVDHVREPEESNNLRDILGLLRAHIERESQQVALNAGDERFFAAHCDLAKHLASQGANMHSYSGARNDSRFRAYRERTETFLKSLKLGSHYHEQAWLLLLPAPSSCAGKTTAGKRWHLSRHAIPGLPAEASKKLRMKMCNLVNTLSSKRNRHVAFVSQLAAIDEVLQQLTTSELYFASKLANARAVAPDGRKLFSNEIATWAAHAEELAEQLSHVLEKLQEHCDVHAVTATASRLLQGKRCSDALHKLLPSKKAKALQGSVVSQVMAAVPADEMHPLWLVCKDSVKCDPLLAPAFAAAPQLFFLSGAWRLIESARTWAEPYASILDSKDVCKALNKWRRRFHDSLRKAPVTTEMRLLESRAHELAADPHGVAQAMLAAWAEHAARVV